MKKKTFQDVLENTTAVTARVDVLNISRTEILREVQKENPSSDYATMNAIWQRVQAAKTELNVAVDAYLLNTGKGRAINFELVRNGVKAIAAGFKANKFVEWFDNHYDKDSFNDACFSVSVLASKVLELYKEFQVWGGELNEARNKRISLKARKAAALEALRQIEAEEKAAKEKGK